MIRPFYSFLASLLILTVIASCALADEPLFTIRASGYAAVANLEFAVLDDTGATVWLTPASTDYGSFGVYTVNNDPVDNTIAGPPGGKLSTYPDDGGPYYTPGPHYVGPHSITPTTTYMFGAGVGPEFADQWVGFRFGSSDRNVVGVRFDLSGSYDIADLRMELWTVDWAVDPNTPVMQETLISPLDGTNTQAISYDLAFAGYNCADIRFVVGPPPVVPEPSGLLLMLPGVSGLIWRIRRSV